MTTVKRSTPVIVAIGVLGVVVCCLIVPRNDSARTSQFHDKSREYLTENFEDCGSKADIQQFTSIPNLVLFLDNDIAVQARQSRIAILQLHKSVRQRPQLASVQFWRVANQLTGTEIDDAITEWLVEQDADPGGGDRCAVVIGVPSTLLTEMVAVVRLPHWSAVVEQKNGSCLEKGSSDATNESNRDLCV